MGAEVRDKVDSAAEDLILLIRQQVPFELAVDVVRPSGAPGTVDIWVALEGSEPALCISLTPTWPSVRILCDGYVFDDVAALHAADLVSAILTGTAKTRAFGIVNKRVTISVEVNELVYTESRPLGDGIRQWEREMLGQERSYGVNIPDSSKRRSVRWLIALGFLLLLGAGNIADLYHQRRLVTLLGLCYSVFTVAAFGGLVEETLRLLAERTRRREESADDTR